MPGHSFLVDETEHQAWLGRPHGSYVLHRGAAVVPVALQPLGDGAFLLRAGGQEARVYLAQAGDVTFIQLDGESHRIEWRDPLVVLAAAGAGGMDDVVQAPMPGTVIAVKFKAGDPVAKGQTMMLIESMKLETAINAWRDGIIAKVHFGVGQTFDRAASLVSLEPQGGG